MPTTDEILLEEIISTLIAMGYSRDEAEEYAPDMLEPAGTHG